MKETWNPGNPWEVSSKRFQITILVIKSWKQDKQSSRTRVILSISLKKLNNMCGRRGPGPGGYAQVKTSGRTDNAALLWRVESVVCSESTQHDLLLRPLSRSTVQNKFLERKFYFFSRKMLDFFSIFGKGGIVLWCFQGTSQIFTSSVNALIKAVILQVDIKHRNLFLFHMFSLITYQVTSKN